MKLLRLAYCATLLFYPSFAATAANPDSGTAGLRLHGSDNGINRSSVRVRIAQQRGVQAPPRFAPAVQPAGPTYAPGGHVIIPTVPQAAPTQNNRIAPQRIVTPTYAPAAPTYAPGGHAIIPTVPQAPAVRALTFSPSFSTGGQTTPNTIPNQNAGTRLNTAPVVTRTSPSPQQYNQTGSQSGFAGNSSVNFRPTSSGSVEVFQNGQRISTTTPQNAATTYGYQIPPPSSQSIGTIPAPSTGRLTLTPAQPSSSGGTANIQSNASSSKTTARTQSRASFPGAASGSAPPNSFQGIGGQTTPAVVGTIPPTSSGRLQLTPKQSNTGGTSAMTSQTISAQTAPATRRLQLAPVQQTQPTTQTMRQPPASTTSTARTPSPGWQSRLPEYSYGPGSPIRQDRLPQYANTPNYQAPRNPLGPTGTANVTQTYGKPWSNDASKLHTGTDIAAKRGAPVAATYSGVVVGVGDLGCKKTGISSCGSNDSWGRYVVIQKSDGTAEAYLHVNPKVKRGEQIKTGDVVGTIYENHLHYNECKTPNGCQRGAVSPEDFSKGNYLKPEL